MNQSSTIFFLICCLLASCTIETSSSFGHTEVLKEISLYKEKEKNLNFAYDFLLKEYNELLVKNIPGYNPAENPIELVIEQESSSNSVIIELQYEGLTPPKHYTEVHAFYKEIIDSMEATYKENETFIEKALEASKTHSEQLNKKEYQAIGQLLNTGIGTVDGSAIKNGPQEVEKIHGLLPNKEFKRTYHAKNVQVLDYKAGTLPSIEVYNSLLFPDEQEFSEVFSYAMHQGNMLLVGYSIEELKKRKVKDELPNNIDVKDLDKLMQRVKNNYNKDDFGGIYNELSDQVKQEIKSYTLENQYALTKEKTGPISDFNYFKTALKKDLDTNDDLLVVVYRCEFENGPGVIYFTIKNSPKIEVRSVSFKLK